MNGLQNVSDFTTRLYRTAAIGATQGMSLGDAWDEANDKGEMFSADVPELTLNVTDTKGKEKFMKLAFSIKSTEKTISAKYEGQGPGV